MSFSESQFITWCLGDRPGRGGAAGARAEPDGPWRVGPGDDAAVLADDLVITLDTVIEGTHFEAGTSLSQVARKALGSAVSDVCAMGGRAELVFLSAQLPSGTDGQALAQALRAAAEALDVHLAGGDTVRAPDGALALAVTVTGRLPAGAAPWTRAGARVGDVLWVSGPLGGSAGGRHLDVRPRADVVAVLREAGTAVHAALDLSDGLGLDLPRLCAASGVGAEVEAETLPVHPDVAPGRDAVAAVLGDGEDFELLLALPAEVTPPAAAGLVAVGRVVEPPNLVLRRGGEAGPWPALGYEHGF